MACLSSKLHSGKDIPFLFEDLTGGPPAAAGMHYLPAKKLYQRDNGGFFIPWAFANLPGNQLFR